MKFNETILGSIIIGTLIGGAILISSAMSTQGKPKIKVMSLADGDRQEQVIHKEVIFDIFNSTGGKEGKCINIRQNSTKSVNTYR